MEMHTRQNGSIISTHIAEDRAYDWLDKTVALLQWEGLFVEEAKVERINGMYRAGVIYKQQQMEFEFE
jgi:hypothetical protein